MDFGFWTTMCSSLFAASTGAVLDFGCWIFDNYVSVLHFAAPAGAVLECGSGFWILEFLPFAPT